VHGDRVASENLRLDHPVPIAAQFSLFSELDKTGKCLPTCPLCLGVFGQGQPGLLGIAECRLSRSKFGAQSIHLHMVIDAG
jgi:hypothetical protein